MRPVREPSRSVGGMLLPGRGGTCGTSGRLRAGEKLLRAGGHGKARACGRWQKFCPSPLVLLTNKNTLETLFRLSKHGLKVLAFSCSSNSPWNPGPSPSPMRGAKILGFWLCCWKLCLRVWVSYDLFFLHQRQCVCCQLFLAWDAA